MKTGISIYCLDPAMAAGRLDAFSAIDWAKNHGAEHIEFVPFHLPFVTKERTLDLGFIKAVRDHAVNSGLEISTYSVNADLITPELRESEIERVKLHVDAAAALGLRWMRHDIASFRRPFSACTAKDFDELFPMMVGGVQELYDYADSLGVHTTLENHGFFCNGSDRIIRIIEAAKRPNLRMTLDVGNFLCVDEYPLGAVKKCLPYAQIIHFKDFYIRRRDSLPGQTGMFNCNLGSWFESLGGTMLRGAITGQGDVDIPAIAREIKSSGFYGYLSVEFEGMENAEQGTMISLDMTRAILAGA